MVVSTFRLESNPERCPAEHPVVRPGTAAPGPGNGAVAIHSRGRPRHVQIRIVTAGQRRVVPVPAPFVGVAVHVVQSPGIGRVIADRGRALQGRTVVGPAVVRFTLKIRLCAAE